jgi:hypothetical protein
LTSVDSTDQSLDSSAQPPKRRRRPLKAPADFGGKEPKHEESPDVVIYEPYVTISSPNRAQLASPGLPKSPPPATEESVARRALRQRKISDGKQSHSPELAVKREESVSGSEVFVMEGKFFWWPKCFCEHFAGSRSLNLVFSFYPMFVE